MSRSVPYRWVVAAAASVGLAGAFGGISTISVLMAPFEAEFGWTRSDISAAYTLLTLGAAFGGLAAGRLADRLPVAPIAGAGVLAIGFGLVLLAEAGTLRFVQNTYLALGLLGFACLYAPLMTAVSLWFDRGAGLAVGLVTAGGTVGQAFVPPLFQAFVSGYGWRMACILFGLSFTAVLLPVVALVRKPPAAPATARSAGVEPWPVPPLVSIGLLSVAALFCCTLMGVPSVHLIAFATDAGLAPSEAATLLTILMMSGAVGRVATGLVAERLGALGTYALVSGVQTVAVALFPAAGSGPALQAVAVAYGLGFGGVMTALVCAVRAAVPRESVGTALALVGLLAWLGMGAGGYGGGLCFDRAGSYGPSFLLAALAGAGNLAALGLLAALRARPRSGAIAPLATLLQRRSGVTHA